MSSTFSQKDDILGGLMQTGNGDSSKGKLGRQKYKQMQKSYMQVHFETVIILLRLKTNSYEKSLFLFIILTFTMSITNINNYLILIKAQYPLISQSSATFSLMSSLKYLDIAQLIGFAGLSSMLIAIGASIYMIIMTFLYCFSYVEKFLNPKIKPRKYFYGRWFVNMANYFQQILFFPFNVIFLSFITCSKENLEGESENCSFNTDNSNYYSIVFCFSLVGIILSVLNEWWLQVYFYNMKLFKKDAMSVEKEPQFLLEVSICRFILVIFTTVRATSSQAYFVLFLLIQTLAFLYLYIRYNFTQASFTYANNNLRAAYELSFNYFLSQQIAFVVDEIIRFSNSYIDQNEKFLLLFFAMNVLIACMTYKFREAFLRYILAKQTDFKRISSSQLFHKISLFQSLNSAASQNMYYDSVYKGLICQHLENPCPHPNEGETCFCKQKIIYDPKKRRDTSIDKIFLTQNNSIFTKFLIKSWQETHLHLNPQNYINYLYYAEFLYFKMKNISLALKNLAILENKYLTPIQQFRLYRLQHTILKHNRKRNHDSYRLNQSDKDNRNKLEVESVIPIEEKISQIQSGIKFIIKNNIRFWAYLEKSSINLNEINKFAKFSQRQLDLLKKLWKQSMYYLDYRKKWRFYYCWYYLYILNKKIKVSMLERFSGINNINENEVFSEELMMENMDDDIHSVHSNLKPDEMEKIYIKKVEMAFDKKSVIFHVNHEYKGLILKVNRALYHGFGYTSLDLVGKVYITQLMPRIYQNIHPLIMKNFVQTGKTKALYSQRKIFCLNKAGYLFAAWKFVKQYVTTNSICEYVALIRPIVPPAGIKIYYIILNEEWDIDSMSEGLYESFGINAQQYQNSTAKQLLNLLILSPKLIRFTKFAKYLTEQDYKLLQNRDYEKRKLTNQQPQVRNLNSRISILAKIRREQQNQFLNQDSNGFNSAVESSYFESGDSTPLSNQQPNGQSNQNNNIKPLSTFNQMYSFHANQNNNGADYQQQKAEKEQASKNNKEQKSKDEKDQSPVQQKHQLLANNVMQNSSNVLDPSMQGTRTAKKKRTLIISADNNNDDKKEQDRAKQLQKEQTKDSLNVETTSRERRNSHIEILEQLTYGQSQFFQTNYIKEEIMKKKQSIVHNKQSDSLIESEEQKESEKSDYEDESEENFKQDDDEVNDFVKLDHLEKGEQISFRIRVPKNIQEMLQEYPQLLSSNVPRRPSRIDQTVVSTNLKITKSILSTQKLGEMQTNAIESRDKQIYGIFKDLILKYHKKKAIKEYNSQCTASFKKYGKQKVIIMKFIKFEECIKKQKVVNHLNKQNSGSDKEVGKKLQSMISGQFHEFGNQQSITDGNQKANNFISMRSEVSDGQQSVTTNTFVNQNRFQYKHGDQVNSDTEEFGGPAIPQKEDEEEINLGKTNGMGYQLKIISESEENGVMSERTLKTFHKDFINRQGAKNISLNQNDNIYIKEDNHIPNKNIKTIQNMKIFVRLFFLILIALSAFTFFYGPNQQFPILRKQSNKVFQAENVLISALEAYNLLLDQIMINQNQYDLTSNQFWNPLTYQALISQQLKNETEYFYTINSDTNYKETFYDRSITPYNEYVKPLFTGNNVPTDLKSQTYTIDIYDLFSQIVFSLQTVQDTNPSGITLTLTPVTFFRQNIFPNLYNGLRSTQNNLVNNLKQTTDQVYYFLIIIILVESILLVSSFIVLFYLIYVICNAFKSVIEVFPKISQRDLMKIKNYNVNLNQNFTYILEKDDLLAGTHSIYQTKQNEIHGQGRIGSEYDGTKNGQIARKQSINYDLEEPNDGNENVGKKSKNIEDGGFLSELKVNIFVLFGIFVVLVAIFSAIFLFLILQSTTNLQKIIDNGRVFIDIFADDIVVMIAMKEKKLDITNYNNSFKQTIQSYLDSYNQRNLQPTVENLTFLTFDDVFNQIFYQNPCVIFSQQVIQNGANQSECKIVAQGSIANGVASFNSFYKNAVFNYVDNTPGYEKLDNSVIFDYDRGIYFVEIFYMYLLQVWGSNSDSYLQGQLTIIIIYVSGMFAVLLIIYLIITEKLLIGRFNKEYSYFRTIYNMYMPDIIILKEKRIKFYLVKHHILNK
ncbi:hypothetical protein ABPG72_017220 [Tetrahymena utriculariae]